VKEADFHSIGGRKVLKLRDSVLPLLGLDAAFDVKRDARRGDYCYVVVVGVAEKRIGLVVSRLLGQQEVAIKSLGKYLGNIAGIAGSTIMGDGRVALIIDPSKLIDLGRKDQPGLQQSA
jgi:two-component system chemotaxis sensor kinase CheA